MIKRFYILLLAIVASVGMSWATENSIVINGTPQVGDNSISLTYYFDPANVPGITGYAPTLKVKCVTDNIWDEEWLSLSEISSGTTTITLNKLGSFQEGKSYDVCFAYYNGSWVDDVFQSFTPAAPTPAVIDLATITSDYVIPDGATLTGTLGTNVKLTIAAGATVTLNGVDINSSGTWTGGDYAGITCPGNATIILADGTVNRIKGFLNGNSAIHIKPNYTLTIEGDGTLYASTQGGAAAIGCGYSDSGGSRNGGNIVINGGTIYANGGSLAAGIGGGGRATIGNITINGGIIYAVGGGTGAGIGGGQSKSNSWKSICGNITISSNVKYLKATKGSGAAHSIGMGSSSYSVCGTVTIPGGATGYVSTSPYVYCNPDYVIELINAIPQPVVYTDECKAAIDEARAMYTALTDDQKTSVTNYSTLTDAEAAYAALLVEDKIAAIGTVEYTAESKALIDAARTAYDALSDEAKALVTNYSTLTDAETAYAALIKAGADAVTAKIAAIPQPVELKLATRDSIESARAAYDALTADQKALVSNYQTLLDAEDALADLVPTPTPVPVTPTVWDMNSLKVGDIIYEGDQLTIMSSPRYINTETIHEDKCPYTLMKSAGETSYVLKDKDGSYLFTDGSLAITPTSVGLLVTNVVSGDINVVVYSLANVLDSAQAVKDLIEAIPVPVTLEDACVNAVQAARDAYNALAEAAKGALDAATVDKLNQAITDYTALIQAGADAVKDKIAAIPQPVTLKLATRDSIESARAAYDALTADQKLLVSNYQTLLDAEAALAELNKGGSTPVDIVWDGNTGIENVSPTTTSPAYEGMTVTVGKGSSFSTYQSRLYFTFYSQPNGGYIFANENGTNITKVVIESTTALTSTMTEVDRMGSGWVISNENKTATWTGNADSVSIWKGQSFTNYWVVDTITFTISGAGATPLDSAQHVKDLIDVIPTPVEYPTSGAAIEAALNAFNELSDAAKGALDDADVQKLNDAATQYAALEAIAAIEAIPAEIVYDPAVKAAIETAREKYDALSDASKALVDDEVVAKLTNAEQAWADLVALIEHNVSYMGKDGELKNEKVALLHIPDPAPEFNGYEFVRWDVKAGDFLEEGLRIKAVYTPIITTQPAAYDTLVYNGTAQTLIEAGVAKEGHIEYRLNEGDWSAELPKADMAAAYVVDYKLVREGHEDYMAGSVTAVIAKAPVTYVAPQAYDTLAYNYNAQVLVSAGQTNDGTIEYSLDPNMLDSWSADLPQAMNAGTYDVYFRVQGDLNHFDSIAPAPVAVTIAKRDIVITAPVAYDTLVYNSLTQALAAAGSADFGTMEYTLTPDNGEGWSADMPQAVDAGTYAIYYRVQGDNNHNDYPAHSIAATIAQAPLTITAENKEVIYGDAAPEFTAAYSGWMGQDDATVISNLQITSTYAAGSSVGTYDIVPSGATAQNYAITFANGKLTVGKADVSVSGAEVHTAKFADGHAVAEVTNQGTLNGIKLNDAIAHVTTAAFSSADVAEHLTITLFYELTGDAALLKNYNLMPTSEVYTNEGVIIEPMLPNDEHQPEEDEQVVVHEGIDVYMYGYCEGDSVGMRYHLNSGNPDEYKIEFEDSRFTDVDWTKLDITGRDGIIYISVPVDMPTGDYKMTVYFRDSRFDWLESQAFNATFHVNLPETYVRPLFGNTIVLVDTCECFTDIQWYYRKDASEPWQIIPGATGHYYHAEGNLTGEYFVKAKMNGVETYTCGQEDMETLYGADNKSKAKVSAYPNPVIDNTNVTIENSEDWEHNLRIVNLMGVEMNSTTFEGDHTVVEMSGYPQGNYMISVDGIMVKVLKQ